MLAERHGQRYPDDTLTVRTGRGGTHLYFTAPPGVILRNTTGDKGRGLGWHIDTRATGGYVVAPGSTVAGRPYTITRDQPPAPVPAWLADLLTPASGPVVRVDVDAVRRRIGRQSAYVQAALRGELAKLAAAREGERNHTLFACAASLGRLVKAGALPEDLATTELVAGGIAIGLDSAECHRTVAKGLARGATAVTRAA